MRDAAVELEREGKPVRYLRSTIVPARRVAAVPPRGAFEELVREAYARAGVPFERLSAVVHETTTRRRPSTSTNTEEEGS